jgi:hypothetical protein
MAMQHNGILIRLTGKPQALDAHLSASVRVCIKKKICIAAEVDVHEHVRLPCKIVAAWQRGSSPLLVQCSAALVLPHLLWSGLICPALLCWAGLGWAGLHCCQTCFKVPSSAATTKQGPPA